MSYDGGLFGLVRRFYNAMTRIFGNTFGGFLGAMGPFGALAGVCLIVAFVLLLTGRRTKRKGPTIVGLVSSCLGLLFSGAWLLAWIYPARNFWYSWGKWVLAGCAAAVGAVMILFIVLFSLRLSKGKAQRQGQPVMAQMPYPAAEPPAPAPQAPMAYTQPAAEPVQQETKSVPQAAEPVNANEIPAEPIAPVAFVPAEGQTPAAPQKNFFMRRNLLLLIAAVLGVVGFFGYQMIINGHIDEANSSIEEHNAAVAVTTATPAPSREPITADINSSEYWDQLNKQMQEDLDSWSESLNRQMEESSVRIGNSMAHGISAAALLPSMILVLVAAAFALLGWFINQRWAALVAGILFTVALALSLTRFYIPVVPMALCVAAFVMMGAKDKKQPQRP